MALAKATCQVFVFKAKYIHNETSKAIREF